MRARVIRTSGTAFLRVVASSMLLYGSGKALCVQPNPGSVSHAHSMSAVTCILVTFCASMGCRMPVESVDEVHEI
jgi:hypothetical protein